MRSVWSLCRWVLPFHSRKQILFFLLSLLIVATGGVQLWGLYEFAQADKATRDFQLAEAKRHITPCMWIWPTSENVKVLAARIARLSGRFEEAKALLQDCRILSAHTSGPVQLELILMRAQRGELEAITPFLLNCIQTKHPNSDLILETMVRVYLSYERYHYALGCLEQWLRIDPASVWAHELRGFAHEAINQRERAIEDYEYVLERQPGRYTVRGRLCQVLVDLHQIDKALEQAQSLTRNEPARVEGWVLLARCRYEQGQDDEARKIIEKVLQLHPNHLDALLWGGIISFRHERYAEAALRLKQVVERLPNNAIALEYWYRSLKSQHDPQTADVLKRLKKLRDCQAQLAELQFKEISLGPLTLSEQMETGKLFLEMDQKAEGLHWLDLVLKKDPNHKETHRILVDYYRRIKDFPKAEEHQRILDKPAAGPKKN
jgi:tetratricopeptide (TPR) repeat protein